MNRMISGIILSGGKSSRFGSNKAFSRLKGCSLIELSVERLKGLFSDNLVVVKDIDEYRFLNDSGVKVVKDIFSDFHPLGGIYTGLQNISTEDAFVCGCDMPFIKPELLKEMMKLCANYDAVIPYYQRLQPLCGIYSKKCLKPIRMAIDKGQLKITELFKTINVHIFNGENIRRYDPEGLSFLGINTVEDYKSCLKICTTER